MRCIFTFTQVISLIVLQLVASHVVAQVTAFDDDFLVNENEVWTGNLGDNDILPAGQTATFSVVQGPEIGSFTFTTGGNFEYTPPLNQFNFQDSVYYQVCVNNTCDIAGVEFYVIFRNTVPFAGLDYFSVEFNTPRTGNVAGNDGDPDSITDPIDTSLDWFKFTNPTNGIVNSFTTAGTFTYTPNAGFVGNDSFQYYVVDHCGLYAISTVYLSVVGPNLNPTANNQTITTLSEDLVFTSSLQSLVTDPENDVITFTLVTAPSSGNLVLSSNGSYSYTPAPNFTGNVSFTYNACDVVGQCAQATVNLTINNVDNDPPQLTNDNKIVNEDSSGLINVALNDFDDTGMLTYSIFSQPTNGVVTLVNSNGQFNYTPAGNYFGFDSFQVQACDGVNCATSIVSIQINGINDAPTATPFLLSLPEDTNSSGSITTIIDAEPNALVYSTPGGNSIAGLTINSNGTYQYSAPANYFGTQSITVQGCDPQNLCVTTTLTVTVNSVNDLPITQNDVFTINEDQVFNGNLANGEYDVEGSSLSYSISATATGAQINSSGNGQFTYTPANNWFGTETLNVNVCDDQNGCTTTTLTITVNSVNDLPTALPVNLTTTEDNPIIDQLSGFVSDVETAQLNYSLLAAPANGTLNIANSGLITYSPPANYSGVSSATFEACDANGACVSGIISLTVTAVNDAPQAQNITLNINEDQTSNGIANGITDVDHANLSITITAAAQHGEFNLGANGSYSYIPNDNYFGTDFISYTVCDPLGLCANGQFIVNIASVEDFPQVTGESLAVVEGNVLNGNAASNDSDGDGDLLTYQLLGSAQNGTLVFNSNGTFSYTSNPGFLGNESVNYMVCDANNNCASATLSIDVLTANTPPTAISSALTSMEDEVINGNLMTSITDAEGGVFVFTTLTAPIHGTLQWTTGGNYSYIPDSNYYGTDSFIYRACDNGGLCTEAEVSITIGAINDAPIAVAESASVNEDGALSITVSENDLDAEGDAIAYSIVTGGEFGTSEIDANGNVSYIPNPNYFGLDFITYSLCDALNACTQAVLEIEVFSVNDAPDASQTNINLQEDEAIESNLTNLVDHVDSEMLFFGTMIAPANGTVTIQNTGEYTYQPNSNYYGNDQFTYLVCDPAGACDTASISIVIASVNDAPIAVSDAIEIEEDQTFEYNIAANDSDAENDELTYTLLNSPLLGVATLSTNGNLSFVPFDNAYGLETLYIEICDAQGTCSEGVVTINIQSINDLPTLSAFTVSLNEDESVNSAITDIASDVEDSNLTFVVTNDASNGILTFNEDGTFSYQPTENYNGTENINFTVCDNEGGCSNGTFSIEVIAVNDVPTSQNAELVLSEDSATEGNFIDYTQDSDNEPLFISVVQNTTNGTFVSNADGSFVYAPQANYFGMDTLVYAACDAQGACDTATIYLEITFVNDLPIINNEGFQIIVNTSTSGSVAVNDVELDMEPLVYSIIDDQSGGTFNLLPDGSFTYTPATDTTGLFTINYAACDPCNACDYGTLTFFVVNADEANTAPVASNFVGQTCPGGSIAINLFNLISDEQESSDLLNLSFGSANTGNYQLDAETQELIYQASSFATGQVIIPYYVCDNGVISMCDTASIILDILATSPVEITGFNTEQITCFGAANGSISVEAQTASGNIQYTWSNSDNSSSIDELAPGIYSVVISSDASCPIAQTAQFEIFEPAELLTTYSFADANQNNSTIGDTIYLAISGGTPGYTIEWNTPNGLIVNETELEVTTNGAFNYTVTDANGCSVSDVIVVAGVNENRQNEIVELFPNPIANNQLLNLKAESEIASVLIFDSKGNLVSANYPNSKQTAIDTKEWSSGVYTVRLLTSLSVKNYRIVKQ